jgi:hypothetical protein
MGRRKNADDSSHSANKRVRTSTPVFRAAQVSSSRVSTSSNRTSRLTIIKKNARGRRGHQTVDQTEGRGLDSLIADDLQVPDEVVPDLPLPDLAGPQSPKPKRQQKNTTSVRILTFIY